MMFCDTDHVLHVEGDGVTADNVTFTSLTPAVLDIDSAGNVTLNKTGTARIEATVAADNGDGLQAQDIMILKLLFLIRYLDEQALSSVLEGLLLNRSGLFPWNRGRAERKGKGGGKYE